MIYSIFSMSSLLMVCMNVLNDLLYLLCEYDFDGVVQVVLLIYSICSMSMILMVCVYVLDDLLYLLGEYDVMMKYIKNIHLTASLRDKLGPLETSKNTYNGVTII